MTEYRCKCCGAALDVNDGAVVSKCGFCGVLQTVPRLDFDEKAILWERADKLRRAGEYDRAEELYDELLRLDDGEPEFYWCKVLCHYGIEYVEERGSKKRVPTINRFSYKPVLDDEDYRAAVHIDDSGRRRLYITQAQELEELRRQVLAVSQTEQPYDIFICYKETDHNGRRTADSISAAELYRVLAADGYRVFFARVTLEDKTGREYEPYIFSAINSAKLMLAVGSSPENFSAPWVKNEWSRYLTRISESGEGNLAVLYFDMRREDLPAEFAHLQSYDMKAPDFTEELLRGVHKLFSEKQSADDSESASAAQTVAENAAGLLRRAEIMLSEGEYSRAEELCESALDLEPENARIYLVKLLSGFEIKSPEQIAELSGDLEKSQNYRMIMRFGDDEMKAELSEYRKRAAYKYYSGAFAAAENEAQFQACEKGLLSLDGFEDSAELAKKCAESIEGLREKSRRFAEENALRIENERKAAEAEKARRKKRRKVSIIFASIAVGAVVIAVVSLNVSRGAALSNRYKIAVEMRQNGDYEGAEEAFAALGNYSDAKAQAAETRFQNLSALIESGELDKADTLLAKSYERLGAREIEEARNKLKYAQASKALENGEFDKANVMFSGIRGYSDSAEKSQEALYKKAEEYLAEGEDEEAERVFTELSDYSDSAERACGIRVSRAKALAENGQYAKAYALLENLNGADVDEMLPDIKYAYAEILESQKETDKAIKMFESLGDWKDASERALKARYNRACGYLEKEEFALAERDFKALGDYADSAEKLAGMDKLRRAHLPIGSEITLGKFPMEFIGMGYTGAHDIDWIVIDRDGTRVLAISKQVLDVREFGGETWAESSIRQWLNGEFYEKCFTDEEKAKIQTVTNTTPDNDKSLTDGGADTEDRVFLLSYEEASEMSARQRVCLATEQCREKYKAGLTDLDDVYKDFYADGMAWWLRSSGSLHCHSYVHSSDQGEIFRTGRAYGVGGIRPAVWIEMGA